MASSPVAWTEHAFDGLHRAGFHSGGARRAVVDFLGEQDCCLSAQEIFDGIRAQGGKAGIASVYRALETLAQLELVQRVDFGDGVARYEPAHADGEHHHHVVCDDCGHVEAFSDPVLEDALGRVAGRLGFDMGTHEVVLRGACDDCRAHG
ncbi:MAG TPA: Fur family transcriptional regulator [Gaiellaceae bacterium]|nr:Fur family transcriptional regulator [Gaiellaceae bacterium]